MAKNMDVSAANAELILVVEDLYPSGVALEGFSTDSIFSTDAVELTETRRSVDGKMSAGVVKNVTPVTISLEASSPSLPVFEFLRDSQNINNRIYELTLTVHLPAIGKTVQFVHGVLKSGPATPAAQRTLQPTQWTMEFERVL